ncbi:MAG: site-2 protease family protein [Planctomycetota bacterium]
MARHEPSLTIHTVPPLGGGASAWSAPLGRWARVPVRIHLSFAVVLVLGIGVCVQAGTTLAWLVLAAYLTSLFVHESAHVFAVAWPKHGSLRSLTNDPIVLGPFGGLRVLGAGLPARERVFVAMAGPVASLALVVSSMCVLLGNSQDVVVTELLGTFLVDPATALDAASAPDASPLTMLAPLLIAINWPLFLLNLVPASPFDGGVAFRSWLSVWMGKRPARDATCLAALLIAAGLLGAGGALVLAGAAPELIGAALATLAVIVAFGARADALGDQLTPLWPSIVADDPIGATLGDRDRARKEDLVAAELKASEQNGVRGEEESSTGESSEERWDDDRVDDVLAKVHEQGIDGLTPIERAILQHASRRYQRERRPRDDD